MRRSTCPYLRLNRLLTALALAIAGPLSAQSMTWQVEADQAIRYLQEDRVEVLTPEGAEEKGWYARFVREENPPVLLGGELDATRRFVDAPIYGIRLIARRLAFDLLQRQLRGIDEYLPTASLPASWLDKPFADCADRLRPAAEACVRHGLFSALTMNTQPLHLNEDYAQKHSEFGRRIVNGIFTLGLAVGITVPELTEGTLVANLGYERVVHPHPMFHGDTLYMTTEVIEKRDSRSRPTQGIVHFRHT